MPFVDKDCVTHYYACDCREAKFKELERKAGLWDLLEKLPEGIALAHKTGFDDNDEPDVRQGEVA